MDEIEEYEDDNIELDEDFTLDEDGFAWEDDFITL